MPSRVIMPALEMGQETGKLVAWRKKEGESVSIGELLLDVETDKAVVEIEALATGILAGINLQPGEEVPVGQTIAWIVAPGEQVPSNDGSPEVASKPRGTSAPVTSARVGFTNAPAQAGAKISPKARRLAKEKGIDVGSLQGSGAGGEILAADILAAAEHRSFRSAGAAEDSTPIARLMAERTTQSWTTVPHFFLVREIDAGALLEARQRLLPEVEQAVGVRLTHSDLLVTYIAKTLAKHREVNANWTGEGIRHNAEVNVGLAMAVNDGVVVPVIRHADHLHLSEVTLRRHELAERARSGRLRPADLAGGTVTISNLGMYDVDAFSAIIVQPQAAILAVGRIAERVVAVDGQARVRPMMTFTLSCDHRVIDGVKAAIFLRNLCAAIAAANL